MSNLASSLNVKQKILIIQKVIRSCDTNIVIIQHCETHLNKNQEWYVKEIDYQNFNNESKNSSRIVSNNQWWNWILDSLHTFFLHIHWALTKYGNMGGNKTKVERERELTGRIYKIWISYWKWTGDLDRRLLTLHLSYKETVFLPNSNFGWKDVNSRKWW